MAKAADPIRARAAAVSIIKGLRAHGHTAYFAGGCVRDELLGLHPTDFDVATSAIPAQVKSIFPRTSEVGESFGVLLVRPPATSSGERETEPIEVATFRADGTYHDNRRPSVVHFTDARHDAERRDFTINALFLDPLEPPASGTTTSGLVIDFVGGLADLQSKAIRAVGDPEARLAEDHLRALRAVRFAARLGFTIEHATASAISKHATDLTGVSRERIGEELRRMLVHPARAVAARTLIDLSLDLPVLSDRKKPLPPANPTHTQAQLQTLERLPAQADFPTALAAWLVGRHPTDVEDPAGIRAAASRWRQALLISNDESEDLTGMLLDRLAMRHNWANAGIPRQKRLAMHPTFARALTALRAQHPPEADSIDQSLAHLGIAASAPGPEPLIDGTMLIALGMTPGPQFKRILDAVYDAQLEGTISDQAQAMELVGKLRV